MNKWSLLGGHLFMYDLVFSGGIPSLRGWISVSSGGKWCILWDYRTYYNLILLFILVPLVLRLPHKNIPFSSPKFDKDGLIHNCAKAHFFLLFPTDWARVQFLAKKCDFPTQSLPLVFFFRIVYNKETAKCKNMNLHLRRL